MARTGLFSLFRASVMSNPGNNSSFYHHAGSTMTKLCTVHHSNCLSRKFFSNSHPPEVPHKEQDSSNSLYGTLSSLSSQIVHDDANVVAINKPQHLSVYGGSSFAERIPDASSKDTEVNSSPAPTQSVVQMLPDLAADLGCEDLQLELSLKSFYSGVVLLCKSQTSSASFEKFLSKAAAQKVPFMSYLAVTVGLPQCSYGVPLHSYVAREFLHGQEMSVIYEKDNNSARKDGKMMLLSHTVEPLAVNSKLGVALTKISVNKDKWGAVEAVLSHYLSPVLGDTTYSPRTFTVMGTPFAASPHAAPPGRQRLPASLTDHLRSDPSLTTEDKSRLFVHRHQIHLTHFPQRSAPPLTITATPPAHFLSTLKSLDLFSENILHSF